MTKMDEDRRLNPDLYIPIPTGEAALYVCTWWRPYRVFRTADIDAALAEKGWEPESNMAGGMYYLPEDIPGDKGSWADFRNLLKKLDTVEPPEGVEPGYFMDKEGEILFLSWEPPYMKALYEEREKEEEAKEAAEAQTHAST